MTQCCQIRSVYVELVMKIPKSFFMKKIVISTELIQGNMFRDINKYNLKRQPVEKRHQSVL